MTCLCSLESSYSKKELSSLAINFLKRYSSGEPDYSLQKIFSFVFHEDSSLFFPSGDMHLVANDLMQDFYHNEAFIKSAFLRKELWKGKHVCLYEFPVNQSRADLCKIDEHSYAYEIKTNYDNTKRLKRQLSDYSLVFEFVYVVCSNLNLNNVLRTVPEWVGIYLFDDQPSSVSFELYRPAKLSPKIDGKAQLQCLSKTSQLGLLNDADACFKRALCSKYKSNWLFLKKNVSQIRPIDYQWAYKMKTIPLHR